ncbi:hypothetical protein GWI33_019588 [Rhynchophorus ferrugineus]|uniref:Uncharacterized protein n=1 Tax=Rhynchophorus ferrugineus TaxID=354439 RepID=A0A834HU44_RHYFE|nr:hypothetical protein GWI33_019588 [Rhynchophorus ferrugineus]
MSTKDDHPSTPTNPRGPARTASEHLHPTPTGIHFNTAPPSRSGFLYAPPRRDPFPNVKNSLPGSIARPPRFPAAAW